MPMFFFLSGVSSYYALIKRSLAQYREERLHRLLVPSLLLSLTLPLAVSLGHFSKEPPEGRSESLSSYSSELRSLFLPVPWPGQGWFLCYLLLYSQLLAGLMANTHPNHQASPHNDLQHQEKSLWKPLQMVSCLSPSHENLVQGVKFWLYHPLKLAIGITKHQLQLQSLTMILTSPQHFPGNH